MFTTKEIAYILQYIKTNKVLKGHPLSNFIQGHFGIKYSSDIITYIEGKGYIGHDSITGEYFLTKKGNTLIKYQQIKNFTSHPVVVFIIIFLTLFFSFMVYLKTK